MSTDPNAGADPGEPGEDATRAELDAMVAALLTQADAGAAADAGGPVRDGEAD